MKRIPTLGAAIWTFALLAAATRLAHAQAVGFISEGLYGTTVTAFDVATNTPIGTVPNVGYIPTQLAVSNLRRRLYIANDGGSNAPLYTVGVVNTESRQLLTSIVMHENPAGMATNHAGTFAYTTSGPHVGLPNRRVSFIDTFTNEVVDEVEVVGAGAGPDLAVDPTDEYLYVASGKGAVDFAVDIIDLASHRLISEIPFPSTIITALEVNRSGTELWVGGSEHLTIVDATTWKILGNPVLDGLSVFDYVNGIVFDPHRSVAYLTVSDNSAGCEDGRVVVVDTQTYHVITTIDVGRGPAAMALDPSGAHLYVNNACDGNAAVIDTATRTVVGAIAAGSNPQDIAIYDPKLSAACPAGNARTKPDGLYHADDVAGVVTDGTTGLMWKRCSEGQTVSGSGCSGTASTATWSQALQAGSNSTFAGYSDWRLPNVKELATLFEPGCYAPSINQQQFPSTFQGAYWSSTTAADFPTKAWFVDFLGYNANVNYEGPKTTANAVRLVRGGRPIDTFDKAADPIPDPVSIPTQTQVAPGTDVTSSPVTVSGVTTVVRAVVSGGLNPRLAINGGAFYPGPATVKNGDSITLRQTSPSQASTFGTMVLAIGGSSASFSVTTGAANVGPLLADGFESGTLAAWSGHSP